MIFLLPCVLQWQAPSSIPVSAACIDLLQHILVPDPSQRYSIADIYQHPWFREHLPSEVRQTLPTAVWKQCSFHMHLSLRCHSSADIYQHPWFREHLPSEVRSS
jgi:serine/threonine protein kinase